MIAPVTLSSENLVEHFGGARVRWISEIGAAMRKGGPELVAKTRAKFLAFAPTKRARAMSTNYTAARRGAEARGARAFALPDSESGRARAITRVYYRSMGGEILCFEALLPRKAAADLASECSAGRTPRIDNPAYLTYKDAVATMPRGKARDALLASKRPEPYIDGEPQPSLTSDALGAQTWAWPREVAPPILHGARLVRLPSELVGRPVVVTHEDDLDAVQHDLAAAA